MMERIEEFTLDGKNFMYMDFSGISTDGDLIAQVELLKPVIAKYSENSLYTIANVDIRFDSNTKKIAVSFLEHNKPYVRHGAVIGFDGVKKLMVIIAMRITGRTNVHFAYTKEDAINWLLKQD